MVASNLSDNSCHLSLIGFVLNLTYKLTHQDVTRFKMEHTVWQLWCSQRYLSWSQKTDTRSLFELDKNPLIKMMLHDSRCNALCNSSDAAREFCWSQKPTGDLFLNLTKSLSSRWRCKIQDVTYCVTTLMQPEISADLKNPTVDLFLNLKKTFSSRWCCKIQDATFQDFCPMETEL
jgi:hypothetical protein